MTDARTEHPHEWTLTDDTWACAECEETCATCVVTDLKRGQHPTGSALLICDNCLDYERRVLDQVADALGHWRYERRSLIPAIRYDRDRADMAPPDDDAPPPAFAHPLDVVEVLWSWADAWAEGLNIEPLTTPTETIKAGLMWAAHNADDSAWDDYREEVRKLRHHARRLAGLLPKRQNGPCVHCGGSVVQDWADEKWQPRPDGLSDLLRCTGCGLTWNDRHAWAFTNRHTLRLLPDLTPDNLVTMEDAWLIFPDVPKATWRKWNQRDRERAEAGEDQRMPPRGWDERGRPLYRVGDLDALANRRTDDTRDGPKARERSASM